MQLSPRSIVFACFVFTACGEVVPPEESVDAGPGVGHDGSVELPPSQLTISPSAHDFGTLVEGNNSAPVTVIVQNTGGSDSGALSVTLEGASGFELVSDDCSSQMLVAGATCHLDVRLVGTATGQSSASLEVNDGNGAVASSLGGLVVAQGALSISPSDHQFGNIEIAEVTGWKDFTVTNTGGSASGTLDVALQGGAGYQVSDTTCTGSLAPGSSCTIQVGFSPTSPGGSVGSLVVTGDPGGVTAASIAGIGEGRVTVAIEGSGTGRIQSSPAGIDCPGTCSATFYVDQVGLQPSWVQSGNEFDGFSGGGCSGGSCNVAVGAPQKVTGIFTALRQLSVDISGYGGGQVTTADGAIDCPGACVATVREGEQITLLAAPDQFSSVTGWSTTCGTAESCMITIAGSATVEVEFTAAPKRVFVSAGVFSAGTLGSLLKADTFCEAEAAKSGVSGTYRAWLSAGLKSPKSRMTHSSGRYVLVDGTVLADDWADLTDGSLAAKIALTSSGGTPVSIPGADDDVDTVWTGTKSDGSAAAETCSGWTSNTGEGMYGNFSETNDDWSSHTPHQCGSRKPIYCVEQ